MPADRVLVVGCGARPVAGATNLDRLNLPGVDVVFDLDYVGKSLGGDNPNQSNVLPFVEEAFDSIIAEDVLEHVADIVAVVNDFCRVLKVGGKLWVRGPDARFPEQLWADPTHKRGFARRSFDGWDRSTHDGKTYGFYFHQNKMFFKVVSIVEKNKGLEYTLIKEAP